MKVKRKEIDKLPDQERVGCCTVSLLPLKSAGSQHAFVMCCICDVCT
jgi:hypothetical protein